MALLATIEKYLEEIENEFEPLAFKTRLVKRPQGGTYEERWCFLNEEQALYIITLSKNTDRVRECKRKLVGVNGAGGVPCGLNSCTRRNSDNKGFEQFSGAMLSSS